MGTGAGIGLRSSAAWLATLAMIIQPTLASAEVGRHELPGRGVAVSDVSLETGGVLRGQLLNSHGQPLANQQVQVASNSHVWQTTTGPEGHFEVRGLGGAPHQILVGEHVQIVRTWAPGTAPPSATSGLLVVPGDTTVLGQNCGAPVCGSGVRKRGGMFGRGKHPLSHPLVVGTIVAAAIAIPIAVSDTDDPASL